ncbi:MAG: NifB/NifX family molybdenum-iron cluster-binding protein [Thermoproteota archaeon]
MSLRNRYNISNKGHRRRENYFNLSSLMSKVSYSLRKLNNLFPIQSYAFGSGMGRGQGRGRRGGFGSGRGAGWYGQGNVVNQPQLVAPTGEFKVAIATEGSGGLEDVVSSRFGRCPTFTVVTISSNSIKDVKVLQNQAAFEPQGVGIASVQMLANEGVKIIIAGNFGPNASQVAMQLGIQTVVVPSGIKVREALDKYILRTLDF